MSTLPLGAFVFSLLWSAWIALVSAETVLIPALDDCDTIGDFFQGCSGFLLDLLHSAALGRMPIFWEAPVLAHIIVGALSLINRAIMVWSIVELVLP